MDASLIPSHVKGNQGLSGLSTELWKFGHRAVTDKLLLLPIESIFPPQFCVLLGVTKDSHLDSRVPIEYFGPGVFSSMFLWREESWQDWLPLSLSFWGYSEDLNIVTEWTYSRGELRTNKMLYSNYKRFFYFPKWVAVLGLFFKVTEMCMFMTWVCTGCMCLHVSGLD